MPTPEGLEMQIWDASEGFEIFGIRIQEEFQSRCQIDAPVNLNP